MFSELTTFLIYIISGILISILFDIFRVLRKSIKTSNIVTYIEDIIFCILVGSFLIWEIFFLSYGELRSYIFIGLILGGLIYFFTISKYFIKINVKIVTFLKGLILKIVNFLKRILLAIFTPIISLIRKPIYFLCINIKKFSKNNFNIKQKIQNKRRNL